ncbi:MAG: GntR family transcriptional regulator [Synergistetes bacterium]|nr:GntR family transcriptional regulator [Synergistota bacterium]MDW8192402.1 GntR family transcriptional regulator [Synergistota bacterium]
MKRGKRGSSSSAEALTFEEVFNKVYTSLVTGYFPEGMRLREAELMEKFGISRRIARKILERLAYEGLAVLEVRKGAVIAPVSEKTLAECFEVREGLEITAIRLACTRASEKDIAELGDIIKEMKDALEKYDFVRYSELNSKFHDKIINLANNSVLKQLYERANVHLIRYKFRSLLTAGRALDSLREHEKIWEAIKERDLVKAEEAIREHIQNISKNVLSSL